MGIAVGGKADVWGGAGPIEIDVVDPAGQCDVGRILIRPIKGLNLSEILVFVQSSPTRVQK